MVKQQGAAVLGQQLAPHGAQPRHIRTHAGLVAPDQGALSGQIGLDIHGAVAAQGAKARVHFGADAARPGTGNYSAWP